MDFNYRVGEEFTGRNTDGVKMTRRIVNITEGLVYYSVLTEGEEEDGCYAVSKKHFLDFIGVYCD